MESAVLSGDVKDQSATIEPEDANEEPLWLPREAVTGALADKRFIL